MSDPVPPPFVSPRARIETVEQAIERLRELHAEGGPRDFEEAINLFLAIDTYLLRGGNPPRFWSPPLWRTLETYADPENYHGIAFLFDPPCGGFVNDFDEGHDHIGYDRPMPGKRARAALKGRHGS